MGRITEEMYKILYHPYGKKRGKKVRKAKKDLSRARREAAKSALRVFGSKKKYRDFLTKLDQAYEAAINKKMPFPLIREEYSMGQIFRKAALIRPVDYEIVDVYVEPYKAATNRLGGYNYDRIKQICQ